MNEAKMILKMFEEGKITLEEAEALLEALGTNSNAAALMVAEETKRTARRIARDHAEDAEDEDHAVDEMIDKLEEEIDQMDEELENLDDEMDDEMDELDSRFDDLEDMESIDDAKRAEIKSRMEALRQKMNERRQRIKEERRLLREKAREYKRKYRVHHGSISEEIHAGLNDLHESLEEFHRNFEKDTLPEIRAAMSEIGGELNHGMSEMRRGIRHGAKEVRRAFHGMGFRDLLSSIFSSIGSWPGIIVEEDLTGSFDLSAGPVEVDFKTSNGSIQVVGTDEPDYKLHIKYRVPTDDEAEAQRLKNEMAEITQDSRLLRVRALEKGPGQVSLQLFVPRGLEANFTLQSSNGAVQVSELQNSGMMKVHSSNGAVSVTNIFAKDISARSSNGRVEVKNVKADMVDVHTSNGAIYIEGECSNIVSRTSNGTISAYPQITTNGSLKAHTSNGRIKVVLRDPDLGVDFDASTTCGSISLGLPELEYTKKIDKNLRKEYIAHTVDCNLKPKKLQIQATTSNGSIYIGQE